MKYSKKNLINDIIYIILKDVKLNGISTSLEEIEIDSSIKITYYFSTKDNHLDKLNDSLFQIKAKIEKNDNLIIAFYYQDFKNIVEEIDFQKFIDELNNKNMIANIFSYSNNYEIINDNTKRQPITDEIKTLINKKKTI